MPTTGAKSEVEAVRKNKLYEEVARRLEQLIVGQFKPGDKIPPERELAEMFNVSRSSIRDAIRTLELMGLVEPRQGMGTVVKDFSYDPRSNPFVSVLVRKRKQILELLDVRKMIEPALAARAATHASDDDIAEMEQILSRQGDKVRRGEIPVDEDAEFHYSIALAADNSVVLKVLDVLMDLLRDTRERNLQVEGRQAKSLAGHQRILAAIRRHNAVAAQQAMRDHLDEVATIVSKQF